jgi:hypothetical protein
MTEFEDSDIAGLRIMKLKTFNYDAEVPFT